MAILSSRPTRRFAVLVGLTIILVVFVRQFYDKVASQDRVRFDSVFPSAFKHNRFHWEDVPDLFPVNTSLAQLPKEKPKKFPRVQFDFPKENADHATTREFRRATVKLTFEKCWSAYRKHAWMKDEVAPLSGNSKDGYGGWAATLVDSLDTLWIMGLKIEFEEAVKATAKIDLGSATEFTINVFETNIRHLGGLLAAYDLSGDDRLLQKAKEFGEMLLKAFDTPNRMPISRWQPQYLSEGNQEADRGTLLAEIGSMTMEFGHLSQLTGDMRWYDAVDRIMRIFVEQQYQTLMPGLFSISVDAYDADFRQGPYFTLGAMADSFYEYLPKMHAMLGGLEPIYAKLYDGSIKVATNYSLFKPMAPDDPDVLFSGNLLMSPNGPNLDPQGQHLACFLGGMFALGGRVFEDEEHIRIGQKLTDGCIWAYRMMPSGIMPETFHMIPCPDRNGECKWDESTWKDKVSDRVGAGDSVDEFIAKNRLPKGITDIPDKRYILRPEAIESVFILYRITGKRYLLDAAWEMFESINNATNTPLANAALVDVTYSREEREKQGLDVHEDSMESFWLAETLKYFYLIFSEPEVVSLDEWVFNTEAHPFLRPKR